MKKKKTHQVSIKLKREVQILVLQLWVYPGMQQFHFITEASIVLEKPCLHELKPSGDR